MSKPVFFLLLLVIFILFSFFSFFFLKDQFIVRQVHMSKDFNMDNQKILDYLNITQNRYIWQYNLKSLEKRLSRLNFLDRYEIIKKYPATLVINLFLKAPVARIAGKEGQLFYLDKSGYIFHYSEYHQYLPLILVGFQNQIEKGKKLGYKFNALVQLLELMKKEQPLIFQSIAQIEVVQTQASPGNYFFDYLISFRANQNKIYLKKMINVELIIKSVSCILLLKELAINDKLIVNNQLGFYYREQDY